MGDSEESNKEKKSFIAEVFDAFELKWKIYHTFKDLIVKPSQVIQSYASHKEKYSNPIKLILLTGATFWIVTSLFVDWGNVTDKISGDIANDQNIFKQFLIISLEYLGISLSFLAILMSAILYSFTRKSNTVFREIVGYYCYRGSIVLIFLLILTPLGYINYYFPLILVLAADFYFDYIHKSKGFSIFSYLKTNKITGTIIVLKAGFVTFLIWLLSIFIVIKFLQLE
jgi:hypothetical protein